jgi:hypothetical protein
MTSPSHLNNYVTVDNGVWLLNFVRVTEVGRDSGAHPASYKMNTEGFSPEVKWPKREADNSPPYSAEVKSAWNHTSTPTNTVL